MQTMHLLCGWHRLIVSGKIKILDEETVKLSKDFERASRFEGIRRGFEV